MAELNFKKTFERVCVVRTLVSLIAMVVLTSSQSTSSFNVWQHVEVSEISNVSEVTVRSKIACAMTCHRESTTCNIATYDTDTQLCQLTVASYDDTLYNEKLPKNKYLIAKGPECNSSTLPDVANGIWKVEDNKVTASLSCNSGYIVSLINENGFIFCGLNGTWSYNSIACISVDLATESSGRTFYVSLLPSPGQSSSTNITLLLVESSFDVSSSTYSTATIDAPSINVSETIGINGFAEYNLSRELQANDDMGLLENVVSVYATKPVNVFVLMETTFAATGALVMPDTACASSYIVVTTPHQEEGGVIIIYPLHVRANVIVTYPDGTSFSVTLETYNSYRIRQANLTGTYITSDKPVAIMTGVSHSRIQQSSADYATNASGDIIGTQMPPIKALDAFYVTCRLEPREQFGLVIMAVNDSTFITIRDKDNFMLEMISLNSLDYVYRDYGTNPCVWFTSNNPVMVVQYGMSSTVDDVTDGDPSMFVLPGLNKMLSSYKFVVPGDYESSYVMLTFFLAINPDPLSGLYINNEIVSANVTTVKTSVGDFGVYYVPVSAGFYFIIHQDSSLSFAAVLYGRNRKSEYAMVLGRKYET